MSNNGIVAKIEGQNLVITIPMEATPTLSSTGKNLVVASSHGNQRTDVLVQGKNVTIGVNAYIKR